MGQIPPVTASGRSVMSAIERHPQRQARIQPHRLLDRPLVDLNQRVGQFGWLQGGQAPHDLLDKKLLAGLIHHGDGTGQA